MSRFLFALAVAVAFASTSTADDKPATAAPAMTPAVTAAPVVTYSSGTTSTARRGLFARLRNRNATSSYSPVTTGTVVTPATGVPAPMPTPKGTGGAAVGGNPAVAGGTSTTPAVVVPAGGVMTSPRNVVVTTSGTNMVPVTTSYRVGLFGRVRMVR